jgi:hypothetical protein
MIKKKRFHLFILLFVLTAVFCAGSFSFFQVESENAESEDLAEQPQEKIVPGAKNIKESTGIYIFLGWMWLSILVLVTFLKLKVKEVDRLHHLKYYSAKK